MSEAENATPNATPPAPKSKVVAGLLAIFLGGFGIHKFYLGYTTPGLILLGAFVLGWALSCVGIGILTLSIQSILVLVEGIIYLTKSDDEFVATYVVGKKGWF